METIIVVVLAILALYIVFKIFKTLVKWLLIAVVAVIAFAFFSNPDESKHRDGLKEITKNLPLKIKDDAIQIDDYKIFSVTKVKVDGEEKITGIGAFGKVWHFDDIKNKLEQ